MKVISYGEPEIRVKSVMTVIMEGRWSWMLFQDDTAFFLSVLCGGVAQYTLDFKLEQAEIGLMRTGGSEAITALAREVQHEPSTFERRNIRTFEDMPDVISATRLWREK
jgi:hypothetical protein